VQDRIVVGPDGSVVVSSRGVAARRTRLAAADLGRLRALLADPALAAEASGGRTGPGGSGSRRPGSQCNDAFSFRLVAPALRVSGDDCPGSPPQPVFRQVVGLLLPLLTP